MTLRHPRSGRSRFSVLRAAFVFAVVAFGFSQQPASLPILNRPPHDVAAGRNANITQLAQFAWQEFLALNWKASMTNYRGTPDATWTYSTPGPYPQLLVWQTYAPAAGLSR